ncbi:MAG: SDR family NAD(P)-dependent oxidoreductase [Pseudomonadota bacterium]
MVERRTFLVTGGGSGLGRDTALALSATGARTMVMDFDIARAAQTVAAIREAGGRAEVAEVDPVSAFAHEQAVAQTVRVWGQLDGAFNAAEPGGPLYARSNADRPTQSEISLEPPAAPGIDLKIGGLWFAMRAQTGQMRKQLSGGCIVNAAPPGLSADGAAKPGAMAVKHTVLALTQSVAVEYSGSGIRVNAVYCDPQVSGAANKAKAREPRRAARTGPGLISWLLSDRATFMTGAALHLPG